MLSNAMITFRGIVHTTVLGILTTLAAAQNPVPQVVGPPSPQAVKPGGGDFTLKVYGANFVSGSVVNWNRQPRSTTYISGHEVDATILASDIVTNTAGYISVTNPPPGGGNSSSSWSVVEVHTPTATIVPDKPHQYVGAGSNVPSLFAADFNNDGILDFAVGLGNLKLDISLGDGGGGFRFASTASSVAASFFGTSSSVYGDFDGDGNLDLAFLPSFGGRNTPVGLGVNLGNGDGTFRPGWRLRNDNGVDDLVAGDFNRDGQLDLAGGDGRITSVFLGNGDGTFRLFKGYKADGGIKRFAGDFNGDGILDLAIFGAQDRYSNYTISVVLGNGDGTFQKPRAITRTAGACAFGAPILVSDFNGDGKLDIAFCTLTSIGIMLGNSDGTFQKPVFYGVYFLGPENGTFSFAAGDFNSDGKTDLIVSHIGLNTEFFILLGNGDGTFQHKSAINLARGDSGELGIVTGDFNADGLLDFVFQLGGYDARVYLQK
jgi:hypothetical protein